MNRARDRSWLWTILCLKMPLLVTLTLAAALFTAFLTLLFTPIYSATTIVAIDSDLNKIIGGIGMPIPVVTNNDYIRYEFFASHSVQLMRLPQIARTVIDRMKLSGRFGQSFSPEYLVQPNLIRLVYNNNGRGITIDWITDTQTFSIAGISKVPEEASFLSHVYSEEFLKESSNQYIDVVSNLLDRTKFQTQEILRSISELDREFVEVRAKYKSVEPIEDIKLLSQKLVTTKSLLEAEQLRGARYKVELDHLKQKEDTFAKLKRAEQIFSANPNLDSIKTEIRQLAGSIAASSVEYQSDHPEYKQAQKKLDSAKKLLKKEALRRYSQDSIKEHPLLDKVTESILNLTIGHITHDIQVHFYTELIAALEKRLTELSIESSIIQNLNYQRDSMATTLQQSLKDQYKLESILHKRIPIFRIVSYAYINNDNLGEYRYFPKRKRFVFLSSIICLFVILFYIIAKELKTNVLYFSWQLNFDDDQLRCIDIPCFAGRLLPQNLYSIMYRHIRDLCFSERGVQLVGITSKFPGEGKASIAIALAGYYKRMGARVIAVDGDMLNRSLSKMYGMGDRPGLADVLVGEKPLDNCVVELSDGVFMLPAGGFDDSRSYATEFNDTISHLLSIYGNIIYINPPFSSDFVMLSENLSASDTIMVAQSGRHSVLELQEATTMRSFCVGSTKVKWVVVNKAPELINLFSVRDIYRGVVRLFQHRELGF